MIHPDTEVRFISEAKGYGVIATKLIPKGTITWALDALDRVFTPEDILRHPQYSKEILEKYTYRDRLGNFVLCWDNGRFVNHSSQSNCMCTAYNFEIAVRDILPGEELTDDYGYLNIIEPFDVIPEEGCERTTVFPDDLLTYHEKWDAQLKEAFQYLTKVKQPLNYLLSPDTYMKAINIAENKEKMDSIINIYYDAKEKISA